MASNSHDNVPSTSYDPMDISEPPIHSTYRGGKKRTKSVKSIKGHKKVSTTSYSKVGSKRWNQMPILPHKHQHINLRKSKVRSKPSTSTMSKAASIDISSLEPADVSNYFTEYCKSKMDDLMKYKSSCEALQKEIQSLEESLDAEQYSKRVEVESQIQAKKVERDKTREQAISIKAKLLDFIQRYSVIIEKFKRSSKKHQLPPFVTETMDLWRKTGRSPLSSPSASPPPSPKSKPDLSLLDEDTFLEVSNRFWRYQDEDLAKDVRDIVQGIEEHQALEEVCQEEEARLINILREKDMIEQRMEARAEIIEESEERQRQLIEERNRLIEQLRNLQDEVYNEDEEERNNEEADGNDDAGVEDDRGEVV